MNLDTASETTPSPDELRTLTQVLSLFQPLTQEARERLLQTVSTYFRLSLTAHRSATFSVPDRQTSRSTAEVEVSPKDFLLQKQPQNDVERVACLAYYLLKFRGTPYFKTLDISKLNTEAAQRKFSNAAYAVNNASKLGYLVPGGKGSKQLSVFGEQFVEALPDREAAKAAIANARPKRRSRKPTVNTSGDEIDESGDSVEGVTRD